MNFAEPRKNIQHLKLREGMHVADLGAGSGHYSIESWLVRWDQEVHADGGFSISAGKLTLQLNILETKELESLPDKIFVLRLPDGTDPFDR